MPAAENHPEPPASILMVDDQAANLLALRALLEDLGQHLVEARSGAEALRLLLGTDFAVILMDVQMEGLDGYETARLIRGRRRSRHTPIIFLTAHETPTFRVTEAYQLGAVDFLVKPLIPEILRSKVAVFVDLYQKRQQVERQAIELRRAHQERWRVTLSSIADAVIVTDAGGKVSFLNPVAQALTGWPHGAVGIDLDEVFVVLNESTRERLESPLDQVRCQGTAINLSGTIALHSRDGTQRPIDASAAPIRDDKGEITGAVLVFRDVSQRRQMEHRLRAEHATARILAECTTIAQAVPAILQALCENLDWDMGTLWLPEAAGLRCVEVWQRPGTVPAAFVALSRQEPLARGDGLPGRVWASATPAWLPDITQDSSLPRALPAGEAGLHAAVAFPVQLGTEVLGVLEFLSRDIRAPDKHLLRMMASVGSQLGQFLDRQRAEQAVRQSEARKAAILEAALDAIVTFDDRGCVLDFNPAAERLFGYSRADVLGRALAEQILPPELRTSRTDLIGSNGSAVGRRIETQARRADGLEFPVEVAVAHIPGPGPPMVTAYVRDLTDQKRAEEARRRAAELARSNAELEQFAYIASHDLQEPLRQIIVFLQLLQERSRAQLDERASRFLGHAVAGAARLRELVRSLLEYARVGSRARPLEPTASAAAVDQALANLAEAIRESGAQVRRTDLPQVRADPTQLVQLFQNLLSNAIKFHGPQPPVVQVQAQRRGNEWIFAVRDNGIGIEPRYHQRIFVIFERLHGRDEYAGTGIGLAVCKRIVERHGGTIWVESTPGEGSVFWFTLPAEGGST